MFTLNEALEAIKNKPEFGVYTRDFGTVIDYNVTMRDSFVGENARQTLILKNLRGTCFNKEGKIISLSFDKFHNLGECDGWMPDQVDFNKPHVMLEKLDGSMVRAIPFDTEPASYRLGTRAGVTEVAVKAEKFLLSLPVDIQRNYNALISDGLAQNCTPIFEYCARDQRIVIDYPEPKLVLTAIRVNSSGMYYDYKTLQEFSKFYGVPVVDKIVTEKSSISDVVAEVKQWIGMEGMVVTFDDGFRVKVKAEDYCLKHRALDGLCFEKDVLALILKNELDDVLSLVPEDTKNRLVAYRESVLNNINVNTALLNIHFDQLKKIPTKKEFAKAVVGTQYQGALFKMYDGKGFSFIEFAKTKTGSQTNVDEIRWLIGKSFYEF